VTVARAGDLQLDPARRSASVGDRTLELTAREYALLEYFVRHADEALPRARIIDEVWDWAFDGTPRIIDVYVRALRAHLRTGPRTPRIQTIRGVGYVLRVPPAGPRPAIRPS
jgi:DNA-binding response OmpR family regulator